MKRKTNVEKLVAARKQLTIASHNDADRKRRDTIYKNVVQKIAAAKKRT